MSWLLVGYSPSIPLYLFNNTMNTEYVSYIIGQGIAQVTLLQPQSLGHLVCNHIITHRIMICNMKLSQIETIFVFHTKRNACHEPAMNDLEGSNCVVRGVSGAGAINTPTR